MKMCRVVLVYEAQTCAGQSCLACLQYSGRYFGLQRTFRPKFVGLEKLQPAWSVVVVTREAAWLE